MGPFARYLDARWKSDRPDIAHAHYWTSGIATQLAARHLGLPAVQTFHELGAVQKRHRGGTGLQHRLRLEAAAERGAAWVAATCTEEQFDLMRLGCARARVSVVPCGVDEKRFPPDGPMAAKNAKYRIVAVGNLLPHKVFDDLIRVMPHIPRAEFVIVGGIDPLDSDADPEARHLRALAAELGVARWVRLAGPVARRDMPALLRSADIVACTLWYGASGAVALEAMACGVPVVASAVGGMLDTVVHDVTGKLIPPRSLRHIAAASGPSH